MSVNKKLVSFAIIVAFILPSIKVYSQVLPATELIAVLTALQSLKGLVNDSINQSNNAARERIHQVELALDNLISKVQEVIDKGYNAANLTREQLFKNIFDTLNRTNVLVQNTSYVIFIKINQTLASFASIADSLPFINIAPYIFAVDPYRLKTDRVDRQVFFYGYFGKILWTKSKSPTVVINNNTKLKLENFDNGRLGFLIPDGFELKEQSFINLKVRLYKKGFLFFRKSYVFNSRIYVEKAQPFSFDIVQRRDNPNKWANFSGTVNLIANSGSGEGARSLSASEFFSRTIGDDVNYDMSTTNFTGISLQQTGIGKCCGCAPSPSFALLGWNSSRVEVSLSAPFHNGHMVHPPFPQTPYWCGGGGSNIEVNINASMKVIKRGEPHEVVAQQDLEQRQARNSILRINPIQGWTSIGIKGIFQDQDERYETYHNLTTGVPMGSSPLWSAKVESGELIISTNQE